MKHPILVEIRAQRKAKTIIGPPPAPVITDRRDAWRKRLAWHETTGQRYPLRIWRA